MVSNDALNNCSNLPIERSIGGVVMRGSFLGALGRLSVGRPRHRLINFHQGKVVGSLQDHIE